MFANIVLLVLVMSSKISSSNGQDCHCGINKFNRMSGKIFSGLAAPINEYPWFTHLRLFASSDRTRYGLCGGYLIDDSHVITAAHCIFDLSERIMEPENVEVYVGMNDLRQLPLPYHVTEFFYPNDYRRDDLYNDIAILRLSHPVNHTNFMPVCLPISDEEPYKRLVVTGYGRLGARQTPSTVLMHVEVDYVEKPECDQMIYDLILRTNSDVRANPDRYEIPKVHSSHICAVNKQTGGDACRGDSGGPLMYHHNNRYFAVGVVSGAFDECGDHRTPGLYTTVRNFRQLINNVAPNAVFCDYH